MHPSLRRALKAAEIDVDDLRAAAATAAGAEKPELAQLRRVTLGTVIQLALLVFAVAAVLSFAGDIDWSELQEDLQNAAWAWIIAGGDRRADARGSRRRSRRSARSRCAWHTAPSTSSSSRRAT